MTVPWLPLVALVITLLLLLLAKRWTTLHLQELGLRWFDDPDVALILYFVAVLPGVALHELSHWLAARMLGVRVTKLSLGPVRKARSQQVTLGSVRVGSVDPVRASIIGLAPLLAGSIAILLVGNLVFGVDALAEVLVAGDADGILAVLDQVVHVADFWLWLYLVFAISNAMVPSESDMAAVRPVLIFLAIAAGLMFVIAGLPAIPEELLATVGAAAGYLAVAFAFTLASNAVFMMIIWPLVWITRRIQDA